MKKADDIEKFVEARLDQISSAGETLGKSLGFFGQIAKKTVVASVILVIFGLATFIWAILIGIQKKSK